MFCGVDVRQVSGAEIEVTVPNNREFRHDARLYGGRRRYDGDNVIWRFPTANERTVRNWLVRLFGTDGTPTSTVTVDIDPAVYGWRDDYWTFGGRLVARRRLRDTPVPVDDHVSAHQPAGRDRPVVRVTGVPADHDDLSRDGVRIVTRDAGHDVSHPLWLCHNPVITGAGTWQVDDVSVDAARGLVHTAPEVVCGTTNRAAARLLGQIVDWSVTVDDDTLDGVPFGNRAVALVTDRTLHPDRVYSLVELYNLGFRLLSMSRLATTSE